PDLANRAAPGLFYDRVAAVLSDPLSVVEHASGMTLPSIIDKNERLLGRKVDRRRIRVRSTSRPELLGTKDAADCEQTHILSLFCLGRLALKDADAREFRRSPGRALRAPTSSLSRRHRAVRELARLMVASQFGSHFSGGRHLSRPIPLVHADPIHTF